MAAYTYVGGPFGQASSWLVGGVMPQDPPGAGDTVDFPTGGSPTGDGSALSVSIEGSFNLASGAIQTQSVFANAAVTIDSGGDLNSSGPLLFEAAVTVQNGGKLEGGGFSDTFEGPSLTVDGSGSSFTEQENFQAIGPTNVTFSNGASVTTGNNPADTDVIDGSLTVTSGADFTATAVTTADGTNWTINQGGSLNTTGGGNLAEGGAVGAALNGTGTIDGATVTSAGGWAIGSGAPFDGGAPLGFTGIATFQNSANLTLGSLFLGDFSGANGQLTVSGAGTTVKLQGDTGVDQTAGVLLVGNDGQGMLTINTGAVLTETITSTLAPAAVAYASDGTGTVVVDGAKSAWITDGALDMGRRGLGMTTIQAGGSMSTAILDVAEFSTSGSKAQPSQITVTGKGSTLTASGSVDVGKGGFGEIQIKAGGAGTLSAAGPMALVIGDMANSIGTVDVTDSGSKLTVTGTAVAGNGGLATLKIENQASATLGALMIAVMASSGTSTTPDMAIADGSGSTLTVTGNAQVDFATPQGSNNQGQPNGRFGMWAYNPAGVGQLVASNNATITIGGTLTLQAPNASDTPASVMIKSNGGIEVGGTGSSQADALVVDVPGHVIGHGTITADATQGSPPTGDVVNNGSIEANNGTLELNANVMGNGTFKIDIDATLKIDGTVFSAAIFNFDTAYTASNQTGYTTTLVLQDPQGFTGGVVNFTQGDTIDLMNFMPVVSLTLPTYSGGILNIQNLGTIPFVDTDPVPTIGFKTDSSKNGLDLETVKLQTLLDAAFDTYTAPYGGAAITADGYKVLSVAPADAGFEGVAYEDTNADDGDPSIIVAFRGTFMGQIGAFIKNILADTSFLAGVPNALLQRYAGDAASFLSTIVSNNPGAYITIAGHSLGGALAQLVGEASGFATAAFNAPGTGQLYNQLLGELSPSNNLGKGGTNINYRVTGDQVSFAGTQLRQTYSLPSVAGTNGSTSQLNVVLQALGNHMNFPSLSASGNYTAGFTAPDDITFMQAILQSPVGNQVVFKSLVTALVASLFDPGPGSSFVLAEDAGSPNFSAIEFPAAIGVAGWNVSYTANGTASGFTEIAPETVDNLPAGVTSITFDPLDASNQPVVIDSDFYLGLTFATSGEFDGTLTESGGTPVGQPMTTPVTITLAENSAATPLGIPAPTDAGDTVQADLAALVTALPNDASVTLGDGTTPVTLNESLTIAQLMGLDVTPDAGLSSGSSTFDYTVTDSQFASAGGTATVDVACFATGTRIGTATGMVAVEALAVGDMVVTTDRGCQPVVWIGSREVDCEAHPKPESVWPVRVRAGAFGAGLPGRDLWLSPDHAVFARGVLVPVKLLINGVTIAQVKRPKVTYYHVELPEHCVILAEGLTVESYLDSGDRMNFSDGPALRLFPDFSSRLGSETATLWETRGAAPLVLAGPRLAAARGAVMARAARQRGSAVGAAA